MESNTMNSLIKDEEVVQCWKDNLCKSIFKQNKQRVRIKKNRCQRSSQLTLYMNSSEDHFFDQKLF